ncbi:MAG: hypothetical protein IJS52_01965 [Bacilli bacterium]|nr:hypothetical protein [Bacilli bacterium]
MKKTAILLSLLVALVCTSCGSVLSVGADGSFEVKKSVFHYAPVASEKTDSFVGDVYFSQGYFDHPSTEYDPHLATASLAMAISSFTDFGPYDEAWYRNQSKYLKEYFESIGFNSFAVNEDYQKSAEFDTIGLAAAKREFAGYTLLAVTPRSGGYFREWANNMHLGDGSKSDSMHEGWYNAANKMISFLDGYVSSNNVQGRVKLWLTGFSRGGATANIAAGLIDNKLARGEKLFSADASLTRDDVYAYTFEAPQGASVNVSRVKKPKDALYDNIFNIVNPLDIVPKVPMKEYGFTRFGHDKYVTNYFYDPANFSKNRATYNAFQDLFNANKDINPNRSDEFTMGGFDVTKLGTDILTMLAELAVTDWEFATYVRKNEDDTKANYDANIASSIFLEELTSHIGDRNDYVHKLQAPLENLMLLIQNEHSNLGFPMGKLVKTIFVSALYDGALGATGKAKSSIKSTWGDELGEDIFNLTASLRGPIFDTYWERPNETFSLAGYIPMIMQNHYPDFVFAHVASQDDYYVNDYNASKGDSLLVVPFLDNADYGRMKFFGYNDIGLRLDNRDGKRVINIDGHYLGKSDIRSCEGGFAAGYYSYATEEKMELFMPANKPYNISMLSYSKKPSHRCEYWAYYEYFALDDSGRTKVELDHYKETVCFGSDRHKRDVNIAL